MNEIRNVCFYSIFFFGLLLFNFNLYLLIDLKNAPSDMKQFVLKSGHYKIINYETEAHTAAYLIIFELYRLDRALHLFTIRSLNSPFHVSIAKVAEYPTQFVYRFVGAILVSSIDFHPELKYPKASPAEHKPQYTGYVQHRHGTRYGTGRTAALSGKKTTETK